MRRAKSTGPKGDPAKWGKLSADLTGPVDPACCQSCGDKSYSLWREHGDRDQPTNTYLWLCVRCSNQLIEPHARLYSRVDENDPRPGAMRICSDCGARDRLNCTSPDLQSKGGPGVKIEIEPPIRVHLKSCIRGQSGNRMLYMKPATGCGSKCPRPNPPDPD